MSVNLQRSGHWDWWKGVAIIAVISIHAVGVTATSNGPLAREFGVVFRQFVNFAVPLFFCIAGYFAGKSWRGDSVGYWRSRGWRVLPAYLIWTTIFVALKHPDHFASPRALVSDYALGLGIGIGYYVIVLLQYIALVPLMAKIGSTKRHLAIMLCTTVVGLAISYAMQTTQATWTRFPYYCIAFIVWAPFFQLGFLASTCPQVIRQRTDSLWLKLAPVAVSFAIVEGFFWEFRGLNGLAASQIKASSFLASFCVAMHVLSTRDTQPTGPTASFVEWIGRSSYMVYLSHMLFLPKVGAATNSLIPDLYAFRPAAIFVASAVTALICIALAAMVRKAFRPAIHRDLLGAG